ncbi:hypothetical protein DAPPUDRAFT_119069 [Daphnia pulex]|uniref:Uncharacterized protein n=1 Tax=Daphnia pulex TaxID=6669 RepID=E9HXC2_DAPPU|nr:hypothetical protein DAPPUDRAFT_119069 [Daphnia pulex]|eukprot:EFX63604.1 hypothetical protein DAPPUDRAFT_119069 [Daphnia pulex]
MTRAFVKMGHEVEPKWFSTLQITQDLTKSYRMREEVWDIAKKNLAYEDHIKKENRQMKPAWLVLLKEAIEYEKTRAIRFDTNIDYRAAILISLSRTGRLITPERLAGLEIYTDKDMENEQTLDDIWERANLELDYQMITAKKGTRGPQKMDKKTLWSKKIMEHLYNLLTSTNTGNWSVDHGLIAERAFQDIGWNLNKCQFRHKFTAKNMVDRFLMLNRVNQNHIWHLACEIINDQKGDNNGDLPPQMLRQTWETTLGYKVHEHRIRTQYKVNKENEEHHLTPVVSAFEAIGWNVPQSALTWLYTNDAQDLLEDYTKRLLWLMNSLLGCREFLSRNWYAFESSLHVSCVSESSSSFLVFWFPIGTWVLIFLLGWCLVSDLYLRFVLEVLVFFRGWCLVSDLYLRFVLEVLVFFRGWCLVSDSYLRYPPIIANEVRATPSSIFRKKNPLLWLLFYLIYPLGLLISASLLDCKK